jgi:hypothetical protein
MAARPNTAVTPALPGVVLGTTAYMSPEQGRGDVVDHRTDIFSLGVVFFEMVDGRRPFRAPTAIETLNAILTVPAPPWTAAAGSGSPLGSEVQRVVHRCLERDPDDRYQTARDLCSELRRLKRENDNGASAPVRPATVARRRSPWMGVVAVTAGLIALNCHRGVAHESIVGFGDDPPHWIAFMRDTPEGPRVFRVPATGGQADQITKGSGAFPRWSRDGKTIYYLRAFNHDG